MQRLRFVLIAVPFVFLACGSSDSASVFAEPPGPAIDTGTATTEDTGGATDTSATERDSSVVVEDSEPPPVDSAVVVADTSTPPIDTGIVVMDTSTPPVDTAVPCAEPGSKTFDGHCYFPTAITRFWQTARELCAMSGAHLVTISSAGEQAVVQSIASGDRWIGMARFEGSTMYRWLNSEPTTFTRWGAGEPNGTGSCVRLRADGFWADFNCSTNYTGICERE